MKALDLVALARQLGENQDEASLRSATSRAYYGAFHFAGERLEQVTANSPNPFRWTGVRKDHSNLRVEWRDRSGSTGQAIANALLHAHELRKKADYDLALVFTQEDKEETFRFVARTLLAVRQIR